MNHKRPRKSTPLRTDISRREGSVPAPADSEKITINLGFVDLGQIDLLVQESFYGNRTDFIRTAIRNQIAVHAEALRQAASRKMLVLGMQHFSAADLQALKASGQMLRLRVLGLASIGADVSPELALETIESLEVLGALHASPAVKSALATLRR
jgi:Arc/MetJ-type ribon-helix-helix transcriptional regulator